MRYSRAARLLVLPLLLASAAACDKASPVAPDGTVLTITANPSRIGLNGTSTITVVGRKPDGNPLNPGTEIRFSTDRGSIDPIAEVGDNGRATAVLRADGRSGAAMVTALTGGGMTMATTTVQIGETDETRPTLTLSANPNDLFVGQESIVTVIARNADGTPVGAGQEVILTTSLGSLSPERPRTRSDGTATATLRSGDRAGTATITALLGSSAAATTMVSIRDIADTLTLSADQTAVTPDADGVEVQLSAVVANAQGQPLPNVLVTFQTVGGGALADTVVLTSGSGQATNTLTITTSNIQQGRNSIVVTASTPGAGDAVEDTVTITLRSGTP